MDLTKALKQAIHHLTSLGVNRRPATTIHQGKVLVMSNLDMKNLSMHREAIVVTVITNKKNNTLIKNPTLRLHFPAKIQELFYHIQRRINEVLTKCLHSRYTSNTFLLSSNKSIFLIQTLVR